MHGINDVVIRTNGCATYAGFLLYGVLLPALWNRIPINQLPSF